VKGFHETDIAELITGGIEQIAEAAMIGFHVNAVCDELVPYKNKRCVGNQCVKVPALDFLRKLQVLFGHFEQHLDIPAFAVDTNNIVQTVLSCLKNEAPALCSPPKPYDLSKTHKGPDEKKEEKCN